MVDTSQTYLAIIIDESGSMSPRKNDVIGGIKTLVEQQRKVPGSCYVTVTKFSDSTNELYKSIHVTDTRLDNIPYFPSGGTALHDAIGRTVDRIGHELADRPEDQRPGLVLVVIVTDGEENCSKEYTNEKIKQMIQHQQDVYSWQFSFMGCTKEAIEAAANVGIGKRNTLFFAGNNTSAAFSNYAAKSMVARSMAMTGNIKGSIRSMAYTEDDRSSVV